MMWFIDLIRSGGFVMVPLILCSIAVWTVILERLWRYRSIGSSQREFHYEAINGLLREDHSGVRQLCERNPQLPNAHLLKTALDRLQARDPRVSSTWKDAVERERSRLNQDLRKGFWILGTIGSASPFIGLFGTVVGILQSFQEMAAKGAGGFAVVASGISEALIATAAGIVVAVVAVMAYNAFQVRWNALVLQLRLQTEEMMEVLAPAPLHAARGLEAAIESRSLEGRA